jgi:peptide/nickel transport system ATP-binding protein
MLEATNLTKEFKSGSFGKGIFRAVNKASFKIDNKDIVSLIGESGSGKTTIGRMILKLTQITDGQIKYNGKNVSDIKNKNLKEYYRKVQGVFQDPFSTFNPIFKADRIFKMVKNEFYPTLSSKEWEKKLDDSLKSVGLNPKEVLNKYPHQLSGGQLQRFLIARALLIDVELLIADEIISMLDASTRIDVLNLLAMLKEKGLSVLFITHDLSLGYYISNKAIILYRGVIVEMGPTDKVFFNPVHSYTQSLLDSVPRLDMKWDEIPKRKNTYTDIVPYIPGMSKRELKMIEIEENHFVAIE